MIGADTPSDVWELKLLPIDQIANIVVPDSAESAPATGLPASPGANTTNAAQPAPKPKGFERAVVNSSTNAPPTPPPSDTNSATSENSSDVAQSAATGLLVNGSVNNGGASAFAQAAAFGNNRKGAGSLYNGGAGIIFDTSSWDAAPFSVSGIATPKPSYNNVQIVSALGGPLGLPHHPINNSNFFVAYQHQANDNATVLPGRVPTLLERNGNFSQTLDAAGNPVQLINPATGTPFPGDTVSRQHASTSSFELLSVAQRSRERAVQLSSAGPQLHGAERRASACFKETPDQINIFGNFAYQGATAQATDLFGFENTTTVSGVDATANWSRWHRRHELYDDPFQIRIQSIGNGRDAVFRESHERQDRREFRGTISLQSTGVRPI